jgi:BlaI family penicillinase repressor
MQILWQKGRATAREITEAIVETEAIAHSTVQTLLRGLEEKGSVAHEVVDRTFVFYPLVQEKEYKRTATNDLVERVFGGDVQSLVSHLLHDEKLSRQDLNEIRQMIDDRAAKRRTR